MTFEVRDMRREDVPACVEILNHIVALGGSTAREDPCDVDTFSAHYLIGSEISNVVLVQGRVVGFQTALEVESGVFSIGTFTDRNNPAKGAGRAVIAKSIADARALGGTAIIAQITEDPEIGVLVLGAGTDNKGPGPLVTQLSRNAASLPIPITIVPGDLSKEKLEAIT